MAEVFGKMQAARGDECSNSVETYTSPCCYHDHDKPVTQCENCGAPLVCVEEQVPTYVCRITEVEEDD